MIKTKTTPVIVKVWKSINKNWGVAVGFLMLLFLVPVATFLSTALPKNTTTTNADDSKPIVRISPSRGQGNKQQFIAELNDKNVDNVESVDVWFGANTPSATLANGSYATLSLKNVTAGTGFDWRDVVYVRSESGAITNKTTFIPDDDSKSEVSKVYFIPSNRAGEILQTTTNDNNATASIKYRKVIKKSENLIQFIFDVEFKDSFSPQDINVYMKAKRGIEFGGATSALSSEWTQVGIWNTSPAQNAALPNKPPKFQSIPSSKAKVGVNYRYAISATDPDGDDISYAIYSSPKPAFLSMSGNVLSGTPSSLDVGAHSIVIIISDKYGNSATQSWTINVESSAPSSSNLPDIKITSPKDSDNLTGTANKISWTISTTSGVGNVKISYSTVGTNNFQEIAKVSPEKLEYTWDSSALAKGSYILKVEALDGTGSSISAATSSVFNVDNTATVANIKPPTISGFSPQGTTQDNPPKISATITKGSGEINPSSLRVFLDDEDVTSQVDPLSNTFVYTPPLALKVAVHEVKVTVAGMDANTTQNLGIANASWTFTITAPDAGTQNKEQVSTEQTITLPIIGLKVVPWLGTIIIGLFVLLLFGILVFAIIMLVRIIKGDDSEEMSQISKYYQQNPSPENNPGNMPPQPDFPQTDNYQSNLQNIEYQAPVESMTYAVPEATPLPPVIAPELPKLQTTISPEPVVAPAVSESQQPIVLSDYNSVSSSPFETPSVSDTYKDLDANVSTSTASYDNQANAGQSEYDTQDLSEVTSQPYSMKPQIQETPEEISADKAVENIPLSEQSRLVEPENHAGEINNLSQISSTGTPSTDSNYIYGATPNESINTSTAPTLIENNTETKPFTDTKGDFKNPHDDSAAYNPFE